MKQQARCILVCHRICLLLLFRFEPCLFSWLLCVVLARTRRLSFGKVSIFQLFVIRYKKAVVQVVQSVSLQQHNAMKGDTGRTRNLRSTTSVRKPGDTRQGIQIPILLCYLKKVIVQSEIPGGLFC